MFYGQVLAYDRAATERDVATLIEAGYTVVIDTAGRPVSDIRYPDPKVFLYGEKPLSLQGSSQF